MSTKKDLLDAWTKWTGTPVHEARHRIRVLSEDGLLPRREEPLTFDALATALLGFIALGEHKTAAQTVRQIAALRPGAWHGDGKGSLAGATLLEATTLALSAPYSIGLLTVSLSETAVELMVHHHHPMLGNNSDDRWETIKYYYSIPQDTSKKNVFPITVSASIGSRLIQCLLSDLMPGEHTDVSPTSENAEKPGFGGPDE